jgi:hypothetical protein
MNNEMTQGQFESELQTRLRKGNITGDFGPFEIICRDCPHSQALMVAAVEPGTNHCFHSTTTTIGFLTAGNGWETKVKIGDRRLVKLSTKRVDEAVELVKRMKVSTIEYADYHNYPHTA